MSGVQKFVLSILSIIGSIFGASMEHVDKERIGEEKENVLQIDHPKESTLDGNEHQA